MKTNSSLPGSLDCHKQKMIADGQFGKTKAAIVLAKTLKEHNNHNLN